MCQFLYDFFYLRRAVGTRLLYFFCQLRIYLSQVISYYQLQIIDRYFYVFVQTVQSDIDSLYIL